MRMMESVLVVLLLLASASFAFAKDVTLQASGEGWKTSKGIAAADDLLIQYSIAKARQSSKALTDAVSDNLALVKGFAGNDASKNLYRLKVLANDGQGKIKLGMAEKNLQGSIISDTAEITVDKLYLGKCRPITPVFQKSYALIVLIAKVKDTADDYVALVITRKPEVYNPNASTDGTVLEIEDLNQDGEQINNEEIAIGKVTKGLINIVNPQPVKHSEVLNQKIFDIDVVPSSLPGQLPKCRPTDIF